MRNDELFSPNCPNDNVKALVKGYAMRGLVGVRGTYSVEDLLARQHAIYEEWLVEVRKYTTSFDCGFYEWMGRDCDSAFVLKPGDLVMCSGRYYLVVGRHTREVTWVNHWRLRNGEVVQAPWPKPVREVELKDSNGKGFTVDVSKGCLRPAAIPPEIFALACEKANGCPMMKGCY